MDDSVKILLVEDDQSMLEGVRDLLNATISSYEIDVITARDGQEGLRKMAHAKPDLIVSDVMMQPMDGLQFLNEVRQNSSWFSIPFIFLSAKGAHQEVLDGVLTGADLYITKPFKTQELIDLIKSQIERTKRIEKVRQGNFERLKRDILQIINHEFRTPLTYVMGYYEMLMDSFEQVNNSDRLLQYLQGIQAGCVRLNGLLRNLILVLDLRSNEYRAKIQEQATYIPDVKDIIEKAIRSNAREAAKNNVTIQFKSTPQPLSLLGQFDSLQTMFSCIIENAIKFSSYVENGRVSISARKTDAEIEVQIQDNGCGFPNYIAGQIYDPFFQHNRDKNETQGAGLGLTIVKNIIDLHQGQITAESSINNGTTFTITLPHVPDRESLPVTTDAPQKNEKPQATVLLAEDDQNLLVGLKELLEISSQNYKLHVITAVDGKEALQLMATHQPDLIVSDIMMPIMDGFAFLEQVQKDARWVQIPFIFVTARNEHEEIHDGLRQGVSGYITKPYDSEELLQIIETHLDRYFNAQSIELQTFETLKQSILNLISPELWQPVDTISDYSHQLAEDLQNTATESELKESLYGIEEESHKLNQRIENLITIAELQTGEADTAFHHNASYIEDMRLIGNELQAQLHQLDRAAHFTCNYAPNLPPIYIDMEQLIKACLNLINVGQDISASKTVAMSCNSVINQLQITLQFGEIIDQEKHQLIAELIAASETEFSIQDAVKTGLIIAKKIIELHNGRLALTDTTASPFRFIITFPQAVDPL